MPEHRGLSWHAIDIELSAYFSDPDLDALSYRAAGLPAGLTMGTRSPLSGIARVAGDYEVKLLVSDGQASIEAPWSLIINP